MELWLVIVLYGVGLALIIAEAVLPGIVMGLVGAAAIVVSTVFGFGHHWMIGTGQVVLTAGVVPLSFYLAVRRYALKTSLQGDTSFSQDYSVLAGREGEALTDLRPAGMVVLDGRRMDVVSAGEQVDKGRRIRVVKVDGNRIVVRAV